ncbi:MAG: DUF5667 domain-containing protein [Candidatus Komeilibacteria bacterium]|nr:DUF5667 domain-containing protein [Candidatus Komeilibacteria bacterium]
MKKIILISTLIIICLITTFNATQAQTDQNQPTIALPGSSKYFFKQIKNYFQSVFTFKPEDKLALNLKLATEKLSEAQTLTKNQTSDSKIIKLVTKDLQAYQKIMAKVQTDLIKIEEKGKTILTDQVIKQQINQQEILNNLSQQSEASLEQAKKIIETKTSIINNLLENLKKSPEKETIMAALKIESSDTANSSTVAKIITAQSHFLPLAKDFLKDYGTKAKLALKSGLISEDKIINSLEAGECVAEQTGNKPYTWYMETLMNNYKNLSADFYVSTAQEIKVFDIGQFKQCFISGKYQQQVKNDYQKLLQ